MGDSPDDEAPAFLVVMPTNFAGICHTWFKVAGELNFIANFESHVSFLSEP